MKAPLFHQDRDDEPSRVFAGHDEFCEQTNDQSIKIQDKIPIANLAFSLHSFFGLTRRMQHQRIAPSARQEAIRIACLLSESLEPIVQPHRPQVDIGLAGIVVLAHIVEAFVFGPYGEVLPESIFTADAELQGSADGIGVLLDGDTAASAAQRCPCPTVGADFAEQGKTLAERPDAHGIHINAAYLDIALTDPPPS